MKLLGFVLTEMKVVLEHHLLYSIFRTYMCKIFVVVFLETSHIIILDVSILEF